MPSRVITLLLISDTTVLIFVKSLKYYASLLVVFAQNTAHNVILPELLLYPLRLYSVGWYCANDSGNLACDQAT